MPQLASVSEDLVLHRSASAGGRIFSFRAEWFDITADLLDQRKSSRRNWDGRPGLDLGEGADNLERVGAEGVSQRESDDDVGAEVGGGFEGAEGAVRWSAHICLL